MKNFKELPLLPLIQESLAQLGFETPTEVQAKVIPVLLENPHVDVHAQAQTGTGKTLAFGIPLLHTIDPTVHRVQALIIAPTRELVLQIHESLKDVARNTAIKMVPIYGGMSIERQIDGIRRGAHIIVGTPGRLNDHLRRGTLSLKDLKVLVLDEADIMLDMGFREEIDAILNSAPNKNIWLFSATVGSGIDKLIKSHMKNVFSVKVAGKSVTSAQVSQYYCLVPGRKRIDALTRFIESSPDFYGIIFCQTKLLTAEVTEQLASKGFRVNSLHGDMKQALRNQVIKGFKDKDFTILVATDVAARGIDISNLTHVINYSLPDELESYVHRIGRTGRAGKEGLSIVFIAASEMHKIKRLEKITRVPLQEVKVPSLQAIITLKMKAVSDFIEQSKKTSLTSPVAQSLKELTASFSPEELHSALVASLEDKFFKDVLHEDIGDTAHASRMGIQEICMELGKESGFSESDVRTYLYNTCQLQPQEVNKVRVLGNRTFISVAENRLHTCLDALRDTPITQEKYKIYLVEDIRKEPGHSRHRDRGDRGDRSERSDRGGDRGGRNKRRRFSR